VKLVHLVGLITKKFVTMHGYMSRCTVTRTLKKLKRRMIKE